jgi:uncharacterized protein
MGLSPEEGRSVVRLARSTIDAFVKGERPPAQSWSTGTMSEPRGVFVTINRAEMGPDRLRGCIGFPYPVKRLGEAVQEAAIAASSEDPRFPPVSPEELDSIVLEVSVLTKPATLEASRRQDVVKLVRIGTDGLIVSQPHTSGLLLPQVATEFHLDSGEFLAQACMKAGLASDAWLDERTSLQVFQAEIFAEKSPRGRVERVEV